MGQGTGQRRALLPIDRANLEAVAEIIREYQPSIVFTHHPTMAPLAGHPDHRDAGDLVLRAIMLAMEETFGSPARKTHQVSRIVCYASGGGDTWKTLGQTDAPNVYVDVAATAAAKDKAQLVHGPTFGVTAASLADGWKKTAQPGYPYVEGFVQLRPVVVEHLRSNPGRPWLGA